MTNDLEAVTVAHFGHFDPSYSRNRVVAKALRRAGATVVEITDRRRFHRRAPAMRSRARTCRPDLLLVGFPGHADVPTARLLGTRLGVPVAFDALVSLYETAVEDRGNVRPGSLAAARYLFEDRLACRLADVVVLDTNTHLAYFAEHLHVPSTKLRRLWVGADDDVMYPRPRTGRAGFSAFFYGSFIPLHGLEYVIRAAHLLELAGEEVTFQIVGAGQTYQSVRELSARLGVRSVSFLGQRPYTELPDLMAASDVCLGIFGDSPKARRVIPNKLFDALAMARPVITADTPAVREALVNRRHAWMCPPGDPEALAAAIVELKADGPARNAIAREGHALFKEKFSVAALSRDVTALVVDVLSR